MTRPLPDAVPQPVFSAPWHAQLFALTVHLNESGLFSWPDWTARFGATLARHGLARAQEEARDGARDGIEVEAEKGTQYGAQHGGLDGGDDYFAAWLETLETLLAEGGTAPTAEVETLRAAWETAYLSTPHGDPVRLG